MEYEGEGKKLDVLHRCKEQRYFFDRIFVANSSQEDVYSKTCLHLIEPLLQGYNATVFAYGTTVNYYLGKWKNLYNGWNT